jgi:hypothetical protein
MSDHAAKRSMTASGHDAATAAVAAPAPGRRTLAEQLDGAAPHETAPTTAPSPTHAAAVEPIPATARPTLQSLFGSHFAATRGSTEPPAAAPADAGPAGAPADAADRGEEAMDALAHDIVEHPLLHDKLAHVPDAVLEQLVRQVGRRALIRIATSGADLPTAAPTSAQVRTEGLQGPDAAGPFPARTGLLARVQSRPADGPEGHAAEQDSQELAGEEAHDAHGDHPADDRAEPSAAVQRRTGDSARDAPDPTAIHASARRGLATPATQLPFRDTIQRVFGRHDLSSIQAHVGPEAARSAHEMGADAYATGNHVVLGGNPDLFTTAHEAAHVIQQRAGVHCKGGVGEANDRYEQHADEVAQLVVQGKSAEALLDRDAGDSHERGGLQEPPVPAQSAAPAGPPIVQRHHRGQWVTRAASRGLGVRSYVGASRVSWRRLSASPASEGEPLTSSTDTDSTPSSTFKRWSKLLKRRKSWSAPLSGMVDQPSSGEIHPPPVLGVAPSGHRSRGYSSSTERDVPESSAGGSASSGNHKEQDELPVPTTSVHVGKGRNLEEKEVEVDHAPVDHHGSGGTVRAFRAQGRPLIALDQAGNVTIERPPGRRHKGVAVHVGFDSQRALMWIQEKGRGEVIEFAVKREFLERLRETAQPEHGVVRDRTGPWRVDVDYPDQYAIPPALLDALEAAIVPGSGKRNTDPSTLDRP